jgi:predicted cytidylate kinase
MVLISVGGLPGSGTSTVCEILEERTGLEYIYAGRIFREMAEEKGMTLEEFSTFCEKDDTVDRKLDNRMMDRARRGDAILEGRMVGPLLKKEALEGLKVFIHAPLYVRARRVMERDGGSLKETMEKMSMRENSERVRYKRYYGMDPTDRAHYDLVIDSSHISPDEEADLIISNLKGDKE